MRRSYRISAAAILLVATSGAGIAVAIDQARAAGASTGIRPALAKNLVKNGSFESPKVAPSCPNGGEGNSTPGVCTYFGGSTGISDWSVGGNSVDMVAFPTWKAAAGSQAIDLSGDAPGSLTQKVPTVKGRKYILRWANAGNWGCGQKIKSMVIYWDTAIVKATNFNTTGRSDAKMGWVYYQVEVEATGKTSMIEFADATADPSLCGAALDNVSLMPA